MPESAAAAATSRRPRFPLVVQTYFWLVSGLLGLSPVAVVSSVASRNATPPSWWIASLIWPAIVAVLFRYAARRCSTEEMSFRDSLLWITRSAITGWMFLSFLTVTPALLAAFLGSVLIAAYGDFRGQPRFAPVKWAQLVAFFYRNRMRR